MEPSKALRKPIFLNPQSNADCKFLVGGKDKEEIFGHKAIFANTSPVFNKMFFGNFTEKGDEIEVPDIRPLAFHTMVEFLYTGVVKITSVEHAVEVWYAAEKYEIVKLIKILTNYLIRNITPENACYIFEFANAFRNIIVMNKCQEIIVAEISTILKHPSFLEADLSVLKLILDQDELKVSELDLFRALVQYAEAQKNNSDVAKYEQSSSTSLAKSASNALEVKEASVSNGNINDSSGEASSNKDGIETQEDFKSKSPLGDLVKEAIVSNGNIDISRGEGSSNQDVTETQEDNIVDGSDPLRELVKKIRFLTMTSAEFGKCLNMSSLLSTSEALSIILNISDPSSPTRSMPEGFSTVKTKRDHQSDLVEKFSYVSTVSGPLIQKMINVTPKNLPSTVKSLEEYNKQKFYCNHAIEKSDSCLIVDGLLGGSLTFECDSAILITGVQTNNPTSESEPYAMDFEIEVLDIVGTVLFSQTDSLNVPNDCFVEIPFDHPVYISAHIEYAIKVTFQNGGEYTRYNCSSKHLLNKINFKFGNAYQLNCACNGLIRSIVYTNVK